MTGMTFAYATHFAGGEITYRYISGTTYEVTLKAYRDCSGINYGSSETIRISPTNSGSSFSISRISITDITPLCPGSSSNCSGGPIAGVEEFVFRTNRSFNALPAGQVYTLSWESCCRNVPITTISNPGNAGWYVSTQLNPIGNSSPVFLNPPNFRVCVNQPTTLSAGASDPNGDVLVYSLVPCKDNSTTNVSYLSGFSATNPLTTSSGFSLDPNTGELSFIPTAIQIGVVCLRVEEFRNGNKIGEIFRDIQITVSNCNNNPPVIASISNQIAAVGTQICVPVTITDADNDNITASASSATSGTLTGSGTPGNWSGQFCWTPAAGDAGTTQTIIINATDAACPIPGQDVESFTITVPAGNCNLGINATVTDESTAGANDGAISVTSVTNAVNPINYSWTGPGGYNASGSSISGLAPGTYNLLVVDGVNCTATGTYIVNPANNPCPPNLGLSAQVRNVSCTGGADGSIDLSVGNGQGPYTYQWAGPGGFSSTSQDISGLVVGIYSVVVRDANGCVDRASFPVSTIPDRTPPVIVCPPDLILACTESKDPARTGSATATDNCTSQPRIDYRDAIQRGNCPGNYLILRTWRAFDTAGNKDSCVQIIEVEDTQPPRMVCPPDITTNICEYNEAPPYGSWLAFRNAGGNAFDPCSGIDTSSFRLKREVWISRTCPDKELQRVYAVSDSCGNEVTCTQQVIISCCASISDFVWHDLDRDGLQDGGEPGVAGVKVSLFMANGTFMGTETTDANGLYEFDQLMGGAYYLRFFNLPADFVFSPNEVGPDDTVDSDADPNGYTVTINLGPREKDSTWDAGINIPPTFIGDRVWEDLNEDGQQNPGEPGVSGMAVRLYRCNGTLVGQTATDLNGNYLFDELGSGSYYLEFGPPPSGYLFSPKNNAGPNEDSDADATGRTVCFNIVAGQNDLSRDAGIYQAKASVGDFVWCDDNHNNCQDPGEMRMANVTVTLYDAAGAMVAQTTTNAYGRYQFSNLLPGDYKLGFSNLPANFVFVAKAACNNATRDSDVNPATGLTDLFTLTAGQNDDSRDAGVRLPGQSIGDFVWHDLNHDGIQNVGEPGIAGVAVYLYNASNMPVAFTTTDANGFYSLAGLTPGNYYLYFGNLPQGWVFSPQGQGGDPARDSDVNAQGVTSVFTLAQSAVLHTKDAGVYDPQANPPMLYGKVLLEGAYDPGSQTMRRDLNIQQLLPLLQPYQQAPWNFNALVGVNNLPADVVDWVMVEFRSATDATQVIDTQVGLLKANGDIVGVDGVSPLYSLALEHVSAAYVVIKHRNHLGVMSALPVNKTSNGFVIDFSSSMSTLYADGNLSNAPAVELAPGGKVLMIQGDGNSDNLINSLDLGNIMQNYFRSGMMQVDINLDGVTNSLDIGRAMQSYFKRSHVPE